MSSEPSEKVKECAESVMEDNPELDKSTAFAICQDMENEGELSDCPDVNLKGCPEGQVEINGECRDIATIEAPPSLLSDGAVFQLQDLATEPLERTEEDENTVRYSSVHLLAPGTWTDAASQETIWYSPEGIRNLEVMEGAHVSVMHDPQNEVAAIGEIDSETVEATEEGLFADVLIDTSDAAGEFADENLQQTLESGGAVGFGGPSVEIESDQTEYNQARSMQELKGGTVSGLAFVSNPASKTVSFARQTAKKGVALSQEDKAVYRLNAGMELSELEQTLSEHGINTDEKDETELQALAEALGITLADDEDEEEEEEPDDEEDEEPPEDDENEEEEEDEGMDMEQVEERVEALEERLQNVEDMVESAMAAEDAEELEEELTEEIESATQDLADAETVQELEAAKEELEARLSSLEDEPKAPKTLADGESSDDGDFEGVISPVQSRRSW